MWDSAKLRAAFDYLKTQMDINFTVVIRRGYMIWDSKGSNDRKGMASSTKTMTSAMMGLLDKQGLLRPEDLVKATHPEGTHRWRQWASMSTGSSFNYSNPNMNKYASLLTYVANRDLRDLFWERIGHKIGMSVFEWQTKGQRTRGHVVRGGAGDGGGILVSPKDWARFCYLFLSGGNWNGEEIFRPEWVKLATTNQAVSSGWGGGRYGYNWWINSKNTLPALPRSAHWSWGRGGRTCVNIPEWDMVVVRLGDGVSSGWNLPNEFFRRLKSAVKDVE
jgi:CubicO group peptidase (beta-lactamase class C family)